jgi:hypothetical protein
MRHRVSCASACCRRGPGRTWRSPTKAEPGRSQILVLGRPPENGEAGLSRSSGDGSANQGNHLSQDNVKDQDDTGQSGTGQNGNWYIRSFTALLRMDTSPPEAQEQRVVVATADGLCELATAISVPRHPQDSGPSHHLEVELLHGGLLQLREQPWETYFRNVIVLPRPLRAGEQHEYAMRLRVPPGQPMAAHYVHVPRPPRP